MKRERKKAPPLSILCNIDARHYDSLSLSLSVSSSLSFAALTDENNIYRFYKTPNDKVLHLRQKRFQAIVPFAYLGILEFKIQN